MRQISALGLVIFAALAGCNQQELPPEPPPPEPRPVNVVVDPHPETFAIVEGEEGVTFKYRLTAEPDAPIPAEVVVSDSSVATVSVESGMLSMRGFEVTLRPVDDEDALNDTAELTLTSALGEHTFSFTVVDDDAVNVVLSRSGMDMREGFAGDVQMRLSARPEAPVEIMVSSSDAGRLAVSPASITVEPAQWSDNHAVRLTPAQDADLLENEISVDFSNPAGEDASLAVRILDGDVPALVATDRSVEVAEGESRQVGFYLPFQPEGDFEVRLEVSNEAVATLDVELLEFTPSNYDQPQFVSIYGESDPGISDDATFVTASADGVQPWSVQVDVIDDDNQQIVVSTSSVGVSETDSASFNVKLGYQPVEELRVQLAISDATKVAITPMELVFTPDNWDQWVLVNVIGRNDADIQDELETVVLSAPGAADITVNIFVVEDDAQNIIVEPAFVQVDEGMTADVRVRLAHPPVGSAVLSLSSANSRFSMDQQTLMFGLDNWDQAQVVVVTALHDDDVMDDNDTFRVTGAGAGMVSVPVSISDDDELAILSSAAQVNIQENGSGSFEVTLAFEPPIDIVVDVATVDASISASPASLTFGPSNWNVPQVVSVQAHDDVNTTSHQTAVELTSGALAPLTVTIDVADDDIQSLVLTPTSIAAVENGSATFSVRLAFEPAGPVTVSVVSSDPGAASTAQTSLTFDATDYAVAKDVTVDAQDDADDADESVVFTVSGNGLAPVDVAVSIDDDDLQAIVATAMSVTVDEGDVTTVGVRLAFAPSGPVTVVPAAGADISASPAMLTFDATNFDTPQSVTIAAGQDQDLADAATTITFSSAGLPDLVLGVTVVDDDVQALVVSPATMTVGEGNAEDVAVSLAFQPAADVTVNVASQDPAVAAPAVASVTFSPANYSIPQLVSIQGVQDANIVDDATTIDVTSAGLPPFAVSVTVGDDDVLNLSVSPASLSLTEGAAAQSFDVVLTQQPVGAVSVSVAASNGAATVAPMSLSFDDTNWNVPQAVSVTPVSDMDALDESLTVDVSAAGLTSRSVSVSVADDDVQALVMSQNSIAVLEGASTGVTVRLAFDPRTPVTVDVASADGDAVDATPAQLSFDSTNYSIPQAITLAGVADADTRNESVNVTVSSAIAPNEIVAVSVTDDDTQSIVLSQSSVTVSEGGSQNVSVSLAFDPVSPVNVSVSSSDGAAVGAAPAVLTFTSADYATPQSVAISGVQDDDVMDESETVSFASAGMATEDVSVAVNDDDVQALVVSTANLAVGEGAGGSFTVRLAFDPVSSVSVSLATSDAAVAGATPASLSFDSNDWAAPKTVTVSAPQDDDTQDGSATITVSSAAAPDATVGVDVTDDDVQAIVLSASNVTVTEGSTANFTARLAFNPLGSVSVAVSSADITAATAAPASLSFDAASWSVPQSVTVTGVSDDDTVDDAVMLTLSGAGASDTVSVTVSDDDVQALLVSTNSVVLPEGATDTTVTVRLAYNPVSAVSVDATSSDSGAASGSPTSFSFDATNYAVPRTLAITGVQDDDVADEAVTFTISTAVAPSELVVVTVNDDDTQALILSRNSMTVTEDVNPSAFNIRLAYRPQSNTTVTIASNDLSAATTNPTVMVFTPAAYNSPLGVTVYGASDNDQVDTSAVVTVSAAGMADETVAVTVLDDDSQAILLSQSSVSVDEGSTAQFTARLAFEPLGGAETVSFASSDSGAATAAPVSIAFNTANYAAPVTVTVTGVTDQDVLDESVTLTASSNLGGTPSADVSVDVTDDDVQAMVLSTNSVSLTEGGAGGTFTVRLAFDPSTSRDVDLTSLDTDAVTVSPAQLSFNSGNYTSPQTVTVSPVDDADLGDEDVDVVASSSGLSSETVDVAVSDDDTQVLLATPNPASVVEGASANVAVSLQHQPASNVTVTVTPDDGRISVNPASLVFTPQNYSVAQNVGVSGTSDDDLEDENTGFTLSTGALVAPEGAVDLAVVVDVSDDDSQGIVAENIPSSLPASIQEGGPAVTFEVSLAFQPFSAGPGTDTVVFSTTLPNVSFSPASVVFDQNNWDTPVVVSVSATDDTDAVSEQVDITMDIVAEATATLGLRVIDDEATTLASTTYTTVTGGTELAKRQNVNWGATRLGVVGFDTVSGDTVIASNTRELDDMVVGPAVVSGGGGAGSVETVEFDGTDFGFFMTSSSGIDFVRSNETASSALINVNVAGSNALQFWSVHNGTDYGLVYREANGVSDRLRFMTVDSNGVASTPNALTVVDGSDDVQPNVHYTGAGYVVLYSSFTQVRCLRADANGALIAGSDTALTGFPTGGAFVASVFDGTDVVAAYFNATNSINMVKIDPSNCSAGTHEAVGDPAVYLSSPPSISYNGSEFAVAYDFDDAGTAKVGVLVATSALAYRDSTVVGAGNRASVAWAGDRWAVRYGDPVVVTVGSFTGLCADGIQNQDETAVDCGGTVCRACGP